VFFLVRVPPCRSEYCYQGAIQLLLEYQIHLQNAGRNVFVSDTTYIDITQGNGIIV
jgi:hypothetical protein